MENTNEQLLEAAEHGNADKVQECIKRGANINSKDRNDQTALHLATERGHDRVVVVLLEGGGDINARNNVDRTALHYAAQGGFNRIVEVLVERGGDINGRDDRDWAALHWAVGRGNDRIVDFLVKKGGDVNARDRLDRTALHFAAGRGYDKIVDVLVEGGGNINARDDTGSTPLHKAVMDRKEITAAVLVHLGADMSLKDKQGNTPLDYGSEDLKSSLERLASQIEEIRAAFPSIAGNKEFRTLLKKGTYSSHNNRVYLAGACNVGKSTLASNLIGEDIMLKWNSTDGLVIYFGRNGIDLEKKKMIPLLKGSEDRIILSTVLRGQPSMEPFSFAPYERNVEKPASLPEGLKQMTIESDTEQFENTDSSSEVIPPSKHTEVKTPQKSVPGEKGSHDTVSSNHHSLPSIQSNTDIRRNIMDEIRKGEYKVRIAPSDLVDFGGQKAFDLTHQLFIQQKGAFVLLLDGRKDLDDFLIEYQDVKMTTRDILLHWVSSILIYCAPEDEDIYPLILFAATHWDELPKGEECRKSEIFTRQLTEMFSKHEHSKRIRYQEVFFINATSRDDSGVVTLKQYLVDVAFEQKSWGEKTLMAWVPLELQMAEMRSKDQFIISYDELCDINKNNADLSLTDKQLKQFLRCQHSLGRVMYFDRHSLDKFIIVQPTAMVDILRSFITDKIFWPVDSSLFDVLNTVTQSGVIKKADLFRLWKQDDFKKYVPTEELRDFIAEVLVHLDILVEPKHFSETDERPACSFIVPCMIKNSFSYVQFPFMTNNKNTIFMSFKLLKSAIPNAMVYKLIGAVLNIWPLKKKDGIPCLFDKAAVLEIDEENDLYLTFKDNRVIVALSNSKARYLISPDISSVIQECLTKTMSRVVEFYHSSFGKSNYSGEITQLFETEVGDVCGENICFTSLSNIKDKSSWICIEQKKHETKYPSYWMFDKKSEMCSQGCTGLDSKSLEIVPEDKHLTRLARQIGMIKFYEFIIHLGLTVVEWEDIRSDRNSADTFTQKLVALCKWRENQLSRNKSPTFQELSNALKGIEYSHHFLCQVFRERRTAVFDLDSPRLQETPKDSVLEELSRNIGQDALHLGVELGLDIPVIKNIVKRNYKDMFSQTYTILLTWKSNINVQRTVRALMLALQYVDGRGYDFLKREYAVKQKNSYES